MGTPVLYDFALDARCYAVRLGASLMQRDITIRDVDVMPGNEHLSPDMLALNPKGNVPFLVDGEVTLTEPAAIMTYLAKGTSWEPISLKGIEWLFFANESLSTFNTARHAALFSQPGTADFDGIAHGTRQAKTKLRQMEDQLSLGALRSDTYLTGRLPGIADMLAFPIFAQSRDLRIEPEAYPALRLWARRVRKLPGFIGMPGVPDYH
ncbi:MAG: glutathione S-transferase family protein [Rhizobiales bacterium]|nr:glutathione S-transferase family protein [Hyphomicrobiales bacterium]MBO6699007.1 glutathione S-transferase family protein [Hyphomicrobiales bacterium]MBO6734740.1 glutathione S-transferase family protein [Hyphomicrobiales bacterium]MBO6911454.1 glutathione S-transferase family protein [Hyphomicrobiales bacterium]MBO6957034.1 glutathione S-transferase family protein [Hyphomicrobiales bacterium]